MELNEYRPISALAILGLLLALAGFAAFAHPVMWVLPVAAVAVCLLSLTRIAQHDPPLLGRSIALSGMMLALAIGAAAPARYAVGEWRTRYEAQRLGLRWFQLVEQHRYEAAFELMLEPPARQPAGEDLVKHYREERAAGKVLQEFIEDPVVRAVAALGDQAELQLVQTGEHLQNPYKERISNFWAVSFDEGGQRKSFIVRLSLERDAKEARRIGEWRIKATKFIPFLPAGVKG